MKTRTVIGVIIGLAFSGAVRLVPPRPVIYFGDSITAFGYFPGAINKGVPGNTTVQMLGRFQRDVLDIHPSTVVILAGINDLGRLDGHGNVYDTEGNIQKMIAEARAANIRVVLCTLLPTAQALSKSGTPFPVKNPARIQEINRWIMGLPVAHVDYYGYMAGPDGFAKPGLLYDGLHPNVVGYSVMREARKGVL